MSFFGNVVTPLTHITLLSDPRYLALDTLTGEGGDGGGVIVVGTIACFNPRALIARVSFPARSTVDTLTGELVYLCLLTGVPITAMNTVVFGHTRAVITQVAFPRIEALGASAELLIHHPYLLNL